MSEVYYRPIIEGMTWSYSRIDCFDQCPYRWFLKYIAGETESPKFYSSYGSFVHKLLEQFYNGDISKEKMIIKYLFDFQKEVQGERPPEKTVQKYIQCGLDYLKQFTPLPYNMIEVEMRVEFEIDGIPFVGYIDYLGEKDGEYYIVDNKSRDLKPRSVGKPKKSDKELDDMLRQLYIYSDAVKQIYGKFPKSLCFNCFKSNTFIEEPFDVNAYHKTKQWVKETVEHISCSEEFNPNLEFFNCAYICGFNDKCCYWQSR